MAPVAGLTSSRVPTVAVVDMVADPSPSFSTAKLPCVKGTPAVEGYTDGVGVAVPLGVVVSDDVGDSVGVGVLEGVPLGVCVPVAVVDGDAPWEPVAVGVCVLEGVAVPDADAVADGVREADGTNGAHATPMYALLVPDAARKVAVAGCVLAFHDSSTEQYTAPLDAHDVEWYVVTNLQGGAGGEGASGGEEEGVGGRQASRVPPCGAPAPPRGPPRHAQDIVLVRRAAVARHGAQAVCEGEEAGAGLEWWGVRTKGQGRGVG